MLTGIFPLKKLMSLRQGQMMKQRTPLSVEKRFVLVYKAVMKNEKATDQKECRFQQMR